MMNEKTLERAAQALLHAAPIGSKVILFGSHARGDADERSDMDFMVVEPEVLNRIEEMVRLDNVLRSFQLPVDILVVSAERFSYWQDTPNTVYYKAAKEGRIYESRA
jgi:predicted nucleotidyltransferase